MAPVYIEIIFDNIYTFATAKVRIHSTNQFSIELPAAVRLIGLETGKIRDNKISSCFYKGTESIKLTLVGLLAEVPLHCATGEGGVETYGMQYFPFISSTIMLNLGIYDAEVDAVCISLPDVYRIIWFRQRLELNGQPMTMTHSQGEKESVYVFSPNAEPDQETRQTRSKPAQQLSGMIPVRLGGKEYLRIVIFPSFYFGVSLIAAAFLAMNTRLNVTLSAVAATWILMLRNFHKANAPQLKTLLLDINIVFSLTLLIWALLWNFTGWFGCLGLIGIGFLYRTLWRMNNIFSTKGVLPQNIEKITYRKRRKNERKNREI